MSNKLLNEKLVLKLATLKILNANRLNKIKRRFASNHKMGMVSNSQLFYTYNDLLKKQIIAPHPQLQELLKKRSIRTLSGVAPVAVLTKPYQCPGKCAFCPTEKNMPKSYLSNEPAVMRAILNKFDPFKQVSMRIKALTEHGHCTEKIELIIMGGTFNFFPKQYQSWFIKRCFDACNQKKSKTLQLAQKLNEKAKHKIVGLTLETRPDYINEKELISFRKLGCTKIELGIQAIDDKILEKNNRGHDLEQIIYSTKIIKQAGFKIVYHIMPNLPGATAQKDLIMYRQLFNDANFQPDMIKLYPTVVCKNSKIYTWYKRGTYKPYSQKALFNLLLKMKLLTPYYARIIRLIRDIPSQSIVAGNKITNLRQDLTKELKRQKKWCRCIRCREARKNIKKAEQAKLFIEKYQASDGTEYFLQYCNADKKILYAFLRLRINNQIKNNFIPELNNCALIREVHTYGKAIAINTKEASAVQHLGFGKKLLLEAEKIAQNQAIKKIAVISGIGVRNYYKKQGYKLCGTYMVKKI